MRFATFALVFVLGVTSGCAHYSHLSTLAPPQRGEVLSSHPAIYIDESRPRAFEERERQLLSDAGAIVLDETDSGHVTPRPGDLLLRSRPDEGLVASRDSISGCTIAAFFWVAWLGPMLACIDAEDTHEQAANVQVRVFDAYGATIETTARDGERVSTMNTSDRRALVHAEYPLTVDWTTPALGSATEDPDAFADEVQQRLADVFVARLLPDLIRAEAATNSLRAD